MCLVGWALYECFSLILIVDHFSSIIDGFYHDSAVAEACYLGLYGFCLCLSFFSLKIKMENCLLTGRTRHTLEVSSETCDA